MFLVVVCVSPPCLQHSTFRIRTPCFQTFWRPCVDWLTSKSFPTRQRSAAPLSIGIRTRTRSSDVRLACVYSASDSFARCGTMIKLRGDVLRFGVMRVVTVVCLAYSYRGLPSPIVRVEPASNSTPRSSVEAAARNYRCPGREAPKVQICCAALTWRLQSSGCYSHDIGVFEDNSDQANYTRLTACVTGCVVTRWSRGLPLWSQTGGVTVAMEHAACVVDLQVELGNSPRVCQSSWYLNVLRSPWSESNHCASRGIAICTGTMTVL